MNDTLFSILARLKVTSARSGDRYDDMDSGVDRANALAKNSVKELKVLGLEAHVEDPADYDTDASVEFKDRKYKGLGISFHVPKGMSVTYFDGDAVTILTVPSVAVAADIVKKFPASQDLLKAYKVATGKPYTGR